MAALGQQLFLHAPIFGAGRDLVAVFDVLARLVGQDGHALAGHLDAALRINDIWDGQQRHNGQDDQYHGGWHAFWTASPETSSATAAVLIIATAAANIAIHIENVVGIVFRFHTHILMSGVFYVIIHDRILFRRRIIKF